jgi:chromosome partitioning protein
MPTTIAVANHKGGVAKTTTAWHLGHLIAGQGHSVLLIDMDPQANLSRLAGAVSVQNINQVLGGAYSPTATLRGSAVPVEANLSIVTADLSLANTAHGLHSRQFGRYKALIQAIESTGSDWDYILIDAPPSADVLAINALAAANVVIIPSQPEPASIDGVDQTLDILQQVAQSQHRTLSDYRIYVIATMVQANTLAHQEGLGRLTNDYRLKAAIPLRKGINADAQIRVAYQPLAERLTWQGVTL